MCDLAKAWDARIAELDKRARERFGQTKEQRMEEWYARHPVVGSAEWKLLQVAKDVSQQTTSSIKDIFDMLRPALRREEPNAWMGGGWWQR